MPHSLATLRQLITAAWQKPGTFFTFLTGAGISAESGIPAYRGSDGIWVKGTRFHKPETFGTLRYFKAHPEEVWQYVLFRKGMFMQAQPNAGHEALVSLEKLLQGRFRLITQNVDNLHRRAGSQEILEIHGHYRAVKCAEGCAEVYPFPEVLQPKALTEDLRAEEIAALRCPVCGAWLRPTVLWFDEHYDPTMYETARAVARQSSILFIVGTSGATNLPMQIAEDTLRTGGFLVDINIADNDFSALIGETDSDAISLRLNSTEGLQLLVKLINELVQ